jgi:hypothetical protein
MTLLFPCGCDRTEYTRGLEWKSPRSFCKLGMRRGNVPEDHSSRRRNLRGTSDKALSNQAPGMVGEGVQTGEYLP